MTAFDTAVRVMAATLRYHVERGRHRVDVVDAAIVCDCGERSKTKLERAGHLARIANDALLAHPSLLTDLLIERKKLMLANTGMESYTDPLYRIQGTEDAQ